MNNELKRPDIIRVDEKDLQCVGHGKYTGGELWYKGKPFTGFEVIDRHPNGNILIEQEHVDGQTMGWEVEYYENGKIKYESLEYGATSVVFRKFDEEGNLLEEGWVAPVEYYNAVAKETGMDSIEE